jgi:hypothetical protein
LPDRGRGDRTALAFNDTRHPDDLSFDGPAILVANYPDSSGSFEVGDQGVDVVTYVFSLLSQLVGFNP